MVDFPSDLVLDLGYSKRPSNKAKHSQHRSSNINLKTYTSI